MTVDASSATSRRSRPSRTRVAVAALGAAAAVLAGVAGWRLVAGEEQAPYDDAASTGGLTLCSHGKPVTEGRTSERPFADVVVGETPLPAGTDPAGAVATLFAYQPREGIAASEFSGSPLTAAARLVSPSRPAARVSTDSWTIGDFVTAFPARFDGYVQLRLLGGTAELGTLTKAYDTADIRVEGDRWHLVRGGHASCKGAAGALADGS
ncbi:MAG TPA: hypothetical protein VNS81_05440 [Nocardioides sp.]|nr:hypothetical protein [Nocardioides sp.]